MIAQLDGRTRKKLKLMTTIQDAAIALFKKRGFDAVTVEDVAKAADVGVATIFRNFGSKEGLVLWDDYDLALLAAIARHLEAQPARKKRPLEAVVLAVVEEVAAVYENERTRILTRADLIARTPALRDAARLGTHSLREGLERVLEPHVFGRLHRDLLAAVIASTLEVAVEEWRRSRAKVSLDGILRSAFDTLERL